MMQLHIFMRDHYQQKYILSGKLITDPVENFFEMVITIDVYRHQACESQQVGPTTFRQMLARNPTFLFVCVLNGFHGNNFLI